MLTKRGWWGLAAIAVLGVALGTWRCRSKQAPVGFVVAMRAVDGDSAIVVWRHNGRDRVHHWIGRVDTGGRTRWLAEVPGEARTIGGNTSGLVIGDGVVALRYSHVEDWRGIDHAMIGFSLDEGRVLWDRTLAPFEPLSLESGGTTMPSLDAWVSGSFVAGTFVEFVDTGAGELVMGLEARSGAVKWQHPWDHRMKWSPLVAPQRLVVHVSRGAISIDPSTGAREHIPALGNGCIVGDAYLTVVRQDGRSALVAFGGARSSAARTIVAPFNPIGEPDGYLRVQTCGSHGDKLVLLLDGRRGEDTTSVVAIVDPGGTILHRIELGHDMHWDGARSATRRTPETASLGGRLPRFVPYIQVTFQDRKRLVMLDLEQGKIVWQGPDDEGIIHDSLMRAGDRWLLSLSREGLVLFDGSTGHVVTALGVHNYHGVRELESYHVGGGRVWLSSGAYVELDEPQLSIFDLATLVPVHVADLDLQVTTTSVRERFGIE
jgi:hypothetical protein